MRRLLAVLTLARVSVWARHDGEWVRRLRADGGRIGYGGLVAGSTRSGGP